MATVLVILHRPRSVALLTAYVVGSMVTSVLIGIGLVAVLKSTGAFPPHRGGRPPLLDISVGILILLSAAWLRSARSADLRRRVSERVADRRARKKGQVRDHPSRATRILSSGSVGLVAALGVAMHLPGLLYLVALADIANADLTARNELLVIVAFNVVMLLPLELPLLGCIVDRQWTQETVERIDAFVHTHSRSGMLAATAVTGSYLVVTGLVGLAL